MTESKIGRPVLLNPELQDRICEQVRNGNYIETASAFVGVAKSTLYEWLKKGARESEGIYHEFSNAVGVAMAEAEIRDVNAITTASANGNWQASAWRLERKDPKKWGRRDHLTAEIDSAHTERTEIIIENNIKTDPQTAQLLKELYRRQQMAVISDGSD